MKDLKFEKFIPPSKRGVPMKRRALEKAKKVSPARLVRTEPCPYRAEFDAMRDQFVEQTLHTKRLAALESLRGVVERIIELRGRPAGYFDEARAWERIEIELEKCR